MISKTLAVVLILSVVSGCTPKSDSNETAFHKNPSVIWDEDTREEIRADDQIAPLAQATALIIPKLRLQKDAQGDFTYEARPLSSLFHICSDEKFASQNSLGICSGVLISPRIVLTAGHCMKDETFCQKALLTFGHTLEQSTDLKLKGSNVYSCTRILKIEYSSTRDYAVIELDRDVTQAIPVKIGKGDPLKAGDEVLSSSYPLGMPLKKDKGYIRQNDAGSFYLRAAVDTFAGSSGSPLFNNANELVGILTSGAEDFSNEELQKIQEGQKPGACIRINHCKDTSCQGERYLKMEGIELPGPTN